MNIYVGNLPYSMTDDELRETFEQYGAVDRAKIVFDRESGRSKGFGFVEMPDDQAASTAIESLNETDVSGRPLKVNEARPREDRPARPGGGGGGGGGFRKGGGGYGGGGHGGGHGGGNRRFSRD